LNSLLHQPREQCHCSERHYPASRYIIANGHVSSTTSESGIQQETEKNVTIPCKGLGMSFAELLTDQGKQPHCLSRDDFLPDHRHHDYGRSVEERHPSLDYFHRRVEELRCGFGQARVSSINGNESGRQEKHA
jgi:hypothetical protein